MTLKKEEKKIPIHTVCVYWVNENVVRAERTIIRALIDSKKEEEWDR